MLSLLEVEKVNQKNVLKTPNAQSTNESESGGFAEIFNFLNLDKSAKKSDGNSKKIVPNTQESSLNQNFNKLAKNENQSSILKSLDEKYNLSKNFLESQKTESQTKNAKVNIPNNTRSSLPTSTTLNSARDLLEFSKSQKQEAKTLRDLNAVANDLKLNIQKISLQKGEEGQNENIKNLLIKQEISPAKQFLSSKEDIRISKEANLQTARRGKQESPNILSNLLQDKELLDKTSHQISKVAQVKTDLKDSKVQAQSKESIGKDIPQSDKKEEKVPKDSKELESKASPKEKVESKTEIKTNQAETLETKGKFQKTESKTLQDSKEKIEKTPSKEQSKLAESQGKAQDKILQKVAKDTFAQEVSRQESMKQNPMEEIKQENITQERVVKETASKESQSSKTTNQTKLAQDFVQSPFASKDKKEVKDSFIKEEKDDKRNIKNPKTSVAQNVNALNASLKEENIRQEMRQQDIFLDNLLKTTEKSTQTPKETLKEATKEASKGNQEKSKINQEIFQATSQAQVENRLNVQNTFLHFSDKLREALQNYRPPITKLSLELNPENLGSVELTITKRGENISVQISSNPNALQLFMQNAQEFKNSLSNLGLNDVNLEFKDSGGNSLGNGDFSGSNGGESGGFQEQNKRGNAQKEREFEKNLDENSKNTQKWNENSLHIYKEVNNPYAKVALVEINFSYYA